MPRTITRPAFTLLLALLSPAVARSQTLRPATRPAAELAREAGLPWPLKWESTGVLVSPIADADHDIISVKDPSTVRFGDRWHIYATTCNTQGHWGMVYLNFADWSDTAGAKQYYMDQNPNLRGYHCAPQVFFFSPQNKWYLIFQSQHPQYSTADDLAKPETWTKPQNFFDVQPKIVEKLWLDYWIICDATHAYLFFTGDNGKFYRSRTTIDQFPKGMSEPVVVMETPNRFDLFEGGATYKIKGAEKYLTIIEALGKGGVRYYRSWVAEKLDGEWTPLADSWDQPFAGMQNVTFAAGATVWTKDISHGELIRDGYDQTMTIDPSNLQLLYQGRDPEKEVKDYSQLPYRLGLLRAGNHR